MRARSYSSRSILISAALALLVGCPTPEPSPDAGSGLLPDATVMDAGDGGANDASASDDASSMDDSGSFDSGRVDSGTVDFDSGPPDSGPPDSGPRCASAAECQNGVFCDGYEGCAPGAAGADALGCVAGTPPCAADSCDEAGLRCAVASCDAPGCGGLATCGGSPCYGPSTCVDEACVLGAPVVCPAGLTCIAGRGGCGRACTTDAGCSDGLWCNGQELCLRGACEPGPAACGARACDEASDRCRCSGNADCDDGLYCNGVEYCPAAGFCATIATTCAVGSTCAEGLNRCIVDCSMDSQCSDGRACNGTERCRGGDCYANAPCGADLDGDGHTSVATGGDDCDDGDPNRFPGNIEICDPDDRDEDCDPSTFGARDADGDGVDAWNCCNWDDRRGNVCGTDCDDSRTGVNPAATETCDTRDNDCDGAIDEGVLARQYRDRDGDGSGDTGCSAQLCAGTAGWITTPNDCDDSRSSIREGSSACDPTGAGVVVCTAGAWMMRACPVGTTCRAQPDGTGLCL